MRENRIINEMFLSAEIDKIKEYYFTDTCIQCYELYDEINPLVCQTSCTEEENENMGLLLNYTIEKLNTLNEDDSNN